MCSCEQFPPLFFVFIFYLLYLALSAPNNLKINLILFDKTTNSFFPSSLFQSNQIPYQPKNNRSKSLENPPQPYLTLPRMLLQLLGRRECQGRKKMPIIWLQRKRSRSLTSVASLRHCFCEQLQQLLLWVDEKERKGI